MDTPTIAYESGRIKGNAYLISIWMVFGLVVIAMAARVAIQIHQRKKISIDDVFLVVAFSALITYMVITQVKVFDRMFLIMAIEHGIPGIAIPPNMVELVFDFHKWVTISLMVGWCTICAVKFSLLFFFKKLTDRIQPLYLYWYVVLIFHIGAFGYGLSVYYITCPWFFQTRSLTCYVGENRKWLLTHSWTQMSLDIAGDLLILVIPIAIVWKIKVSITQKLIIVLSLCLTSIVLAFTVARVAGLTFHGLLDQVWETYFQILAAEVGVFMAAAIAFRSFFVLRNQKNANNLSPQSQARRFFKESFLRRFHKHQGMYSLDETKDGLPSVPRAHMTGMSTFIDGQGRSHVGSSTQASALGSTLRSTCKVGEDDMIPLEPYPSPKVERV